MLHRYSSSGRWECFSCSCGSYCSASHPYNCIYCVDAIQKRKAVSYIAIYSYNILTSEFQEVKNY